MIIHGHTPDVLYYGEPSEDDDCLCPLHGCRLRWHKHKGWVCDECAIEDEEFQQAEMEIQYTQIEQEMMDQEMEEIESCVLVGPWILAECKMPDWA